ncbi:MAG: hypothetical protein K0S76_890 [Herbinix sp.]|jgi:subtilisin family serine protease|nr:hypothetical protein [Herbinix sp.]
MTQEERFKITSNDYADLIISYNGNQANLQNFQNGSVQIMNETYAIVYVPAASITGRSIRLFGYSALPKCYGLNIQRSLEASGIIRIRRLPAFNLRGQGVLVGIIDTGIDYTNPAFLHADGTSKIVAIWDQTIFSEDAYPPDMYYGTEYSEEQINEALRSENPLEIVPSMDEIGHGTALAGIAAGSEIEQEDFSGVVPDSDLVIVKLKQAKQNIKNFFAIPDNVPCYQSNDIMWAAQYLIGVARRLRRPISICIGLGSSQGAHDGRGSLSNILAQIADYPNVTVCIAAGNEGNTRRHFYGTIDTAVGYTTVELNVGENETGFSLELWGAAPATYSIDILSPSGEYIPRIAESLQVNREVSFVFETTQISIDYQMVEAQTGDQLILMRFRNPSSGIWRFQVYGRGDITGTFHVWLPSDDFITDRTYFIQPNPYTTVTSPGNSVTPITVTAYNPNNDVLYQNSSKGYSRINTIKPELAAPGVNILTTGLNNTFTEITGTSAAAAHTAGITAMMLEWGTVRGNYPNLDTVEVKKFLIRGARRSETLQYPNRDWGYGIIDIFNVFETLRSSVISR